MGRLQSYIQKGHRHWKLPQSKSLDDSKQDGACSGLTDKHKPLAPWVLKSHVTRQGVLMKASVTSKKGCIKCRYGPQGRSDSALCHRVGCGGPRVFPFSRDPEQRTRLAFQLPVRELGPWRHREQGAGLSAWDQSLFPKPPCQPPSPLKNTIASGNQLPSA